MYAKPALRGPTPAFPHPPNTRSLIPWLSGRKRNWLAAGAMWDIKDFLLLSACQMLTCAFVKIKSMQAVSPLHRNLKTSQNSRI